jgi:hypothetical protein
MRRAATLASVAALIAAVVGCAAGGAAPTDGSPAPGAAAADELEVDLAAELAEVRERVDDLEQRTGALEARLADDPSAPRDPATGPARPRTAEGLVDQLRDHVRDRDALPEGFEPGATAWQPFDVPDEVRDRYATPGEAVMALAEALDGPQLGTEVWETTVRVLPDEDDPDLAHGAVLSWGFLDDSVEGRDVRVTLTRTDDDAWEPGGAEQRFRCLRGVTDDGELCI